MPQKNAPPLTLADKVRCATDAVKVIEKKRVDLEHVDLPRALDVLAQLEAQVLGKAPGWEDAILSGLIPKNPYTPQSSAPPPPPPPPKPVEPPPPKPTPKKPAPPIEP